MLAFVIPATDVAAMHCTAFVPYSVTAGCSLTWQHSRGTACALLSDHGYLQVQAFVSAAIVLLGICSDPISCGTDVISSAAFFIENQPEMQERLASQDVIQCKCCAMPAAWFFYQHAKIPAAICLGNGPIILPYQYADCSPLSGNSGLTQR